MGFLRTLLGIRNPGAYTAGHVHGQRQARRASGRRMPVTSQAGGAARMYLGLRNPGVYAVGHAHGRRKAMRRDRGGRFSG